MAESEMTIVPALPDRLHERAADLGSWQSLLTDTMLPGQVQTSTTLAIGELGVSRQGLRKLTTRLGLEPIAKASPH